MEQSESRMDKIKRRWVGYVIGLAVVIAAAAWWMLRPPGFRGLCQQQRQN
jgi:HlyD family secretion protein